MRASLILLLAACASRGPQGPAGAPGPSGAMGAAGPSGAMGAMGAMGNVGASGPIGPTGASGPAGSAGATGPSGPTGPSGGGAVFARTVFVGPGASDVASGTALLDALAGIADASASKPYLLKIEPGTYDLGSGRLAMKSNVDIEGSGTGITIITSTAAAGTLQTALEAELRQVQVKNTGANGTDIAIELVAGSRLDRVKAFASGGTIHNFAVHCAPCSLYATNLETIADAPDGRGVYVDPTNSGTIEIADSSLKAGTVGLYVVNGTIGLSSLALRHSHVAAPMPLANDTSGFTLQIGGCFLEGSAKNTRANSDVGSYACVSTANSLFAAVSSACVSP